MGAPKTTKVTTTMFIPKNNCSEYARLSRRGFLGASAAAGAASIAMPRVAFGGQRGLTRPTLVSVFLRGALDGLSAVVPYGDAELYGLGGSPGPRPGLAVRPPGSTDGAVDLDGFFGLNPNAAALATPFSANNLAIVHAMGSTDPSRSHFSAMRSMETGTPDNPSSTTTTSGWMARHLQAVSPAGTGNFRGIAVGDLLPRLLAEAPASLPVPDPSDFGLPGNPVTAAARRAALEASYAGARVPLNFAAENAFAAIDALGGVDVAGYVPANGAVYPASSFGAALRSTASLIKADIGLEVSHYDYGGWDHHDTQGPIAGTLAGMLSDFSAAIEAFHLDMLGLEDRYVLFGNSEFGRRVTENGSGGTDHGSGGVMFVMGNRVQGGLVHGSWPTLNPAMLDEGDLAVTTDYRNVIAEILSAGLGGTDLPHVFDGFSTAPVGVVV